MILELNELFDLSGPFVVEIKSHEHCIEFTIMVSQLKKFLKPAMFGLLADSLAMFGLLADSFSFVYGGVRRA